MEPAVKSGSPLGHGKKLGTRINRDVARLDNRSIHPDAQSDSLLRLIETGKKMCLAPLVAGGGIGVELLAKGSYFEAICCLTSGAVMTLISIATLSGADLLVRYGLKKRPRLPRLED